MTNYEAEFIAYLKEVEKMYIAKVASQLQYNDENKYYDNINNRAILDCIRVMINPKYGGPVDPIDYIIDIITSVSKNRMDDLGITKEDLELAFSDLRN